MSESTKSPTTRLAEIGLGAAWLVGLGAALRIVEMVIGKSPLASAIGGAVIADIVAGLAGVRWDTNARGLPVGPAGAAAGTKPGAAAGPRPETGAGTEAEAGAEAEAEAGTGAAAAAGMAAKASAGASAAEDEAGGSMAAVRRVGLGMAVALVAMTVTLIVGAVFGWARIEGGSPSSALLFGILRAAALAVRDELMLRGIVLTAAARAGVSPAIGAVFAALAGGASIALTDEASPAAIALAISSGWLFAILWQRFRGAWAALGAHGLWVFLVGPGTRGGVLDVTWMTGSLAPGARSSGAIAWIAAAVFAGLAVFMLLRRPSPGSSAREPRASIAT